MKIALHSVSITVCLFAAGCGIYKNFDNGIPENAPPGFAVGLYIPASLLIVVAIALLISEFRRRNKSAQ